MPGMETSKPQRAWYAAAFGRLYPRIYAHRTIAAAAPEAAFAAAELGLSQQDRVLDLCCGTGRHLVHLRGCAGCVTGLDFSAALLGLARAALGNGTALVRGDMRALPFGCCFDAVTNFFTSFGYFARDTENAAVLGEVARVLRPGGRFFMDYLNPAQVRAGLVPESRREYGGLDIRERRWIDEAGQRVNKRIEVFEAGACVLDTTESVRLYALEELEDFFADAGLAIARVYGDYDGAPHGGGKPRTIIIGMRKDA